ATLGHAAEEFLEILAAFLDGALACFFAQVLSAEHLLQVRRGLAALRAVRLVDDYGAAPGRQRAGARLTAFFGELEKLLRHGLKLLPRCDDDRNGVFKRLGELPRSLIDLLHDATLMLELIDRVLELLIEHDAIGDDDDAVEDALVTGIVKG